MIKALNLVEFNLIIFHYKKLYCMKVLRRGFASTFQAIYTVTLSHLASSRWFFVSDFFSFGGKCPKAKLSQRQKNNNVANTMIPPPLKSFLLGFGPLWNEKSSFINIISIFCEKINILPPSLPKESNWVLEGQSPPPTHPDEHLKWRSCTMHVTRPSNKLTTLT